MLKYQLISENISALDIHISLLAILNHVNRSKLHTRISGHLESCLISKQNFRTLHSWHFPEKDCTLSIHFPYAPFLNTAQCTYPSFTSSCIIGLLSSLHSGLKSWVFLVYLSWTTNGWAICQWKKKHKVRIRSNRIFGGTFSFIQGSAAHACQNCHESRKP